MAEESGEDISPIQAQYVCNWQRHHESILLMIALLKFSWTKVFWFTICIWALLVVLQFQTNWFRFNFAVGNKGQHQIFLSVLNEICISILFFFYFDFHFNNEFWNHDLRLKFYFLLYFREYKNPQDVRVNIYTSFCFCRGGEDWDMKENSTSEKQHWEQSCHLGPNLRVKIWSLLILL